MKTMITLELIEQDDGTKTFTVTTSPDHNAAESLRIVFQQLWQMQANDEKEPVAVNPPAQLPIPPLEDPRWYVGLLLTGEMSLLIRHPALGWLPFQMSQESHFALSSALENITQENKGMELRHLH